ncbi:uncharacterized protein HGUI_03693 [Hanseniaspora guilliermondii]|uniref:VPS37 C-terminal domain-containing protein n=1 Tax=Hanseniaspora guilliermondii TaxID=56406 RepID=A0A1L0B6N2_9ASCO|nr:uncharacterized protein HGUI_03693 [Hanseniaspora guilliermondii]
MNNQTVKHFPLPENILSLNTKQLKELLENDEYLNHYVVNKSYHEHNEIIKYEKETKRLQEILDGIKSIAKSLSEIKTDHIRSNISTLEKNDTALKQQMNYLETELSHDNIKRFLDDYLNKIQKTQIDPLKQKVIEDPYDLDSHGEYIETLTKFNRLRFLFNSLST